MGGINGAEKAIVVGLLSMLWTEDSLGEWPPKINGTYSKMLSRFA